MSFSAGQTGIYRDAVAVLFPCEPMVLSRYREGGVSRAVEVSLPGTPIVCEYVPTQARRMVRLRVMALPADDMDDLQELRDAAGPVTAVWDGTTGTEHVCALGPEAEFEVTPVFGELPENPVLERLKYYNVTIPLYLLEA